MGAFLSYMDVLQNRSQGPHASGRQQFSPMTNLTSRYYAVKNRSPLRLALIPHRKKEKNENGEGS